MGLIKAAFGAVGSTLHDQWKEAIRCEDMGNDILMVKKTTPTGVITSGSTIVVAPGQCAIIFDNGRVIDATAEDGPYTFDSSSSPSLFAGQFGGMFKEMWQRFTYNGASAKEQAVYFINTKEIIDNKFGTPNPIIYRDWEHAVMNPRTQSLMGMKVGIRCFGTYTFTINDPFLFMSRVAGTASVYKKELITGQIKSEVIAAFSNITNSLGSDQYRVNAMDIPNNTDEIRAMMEENVFDEPIRKRGIALESFAVESVTFDEKSEEKIDTYELGGDAYTQQGTLVSSYGKAVEGAAKNSAGAMNGFMGIGMMNMSTGGMMGAAAQGPWQQTQNGQSYQVPPVNNGHTDVGTAATTGTNADTWECPGCHNVVSGKFCPECGTKRPEAPAKKFCSNCGKEIGSGAKFCPECGNKIEE
ncbi:MAG: SPFH domain-containing protein [Clostridia bacterium]|nr:SPFH domain-containing protein [Clostridia bacterium]